MKTLKNLKLAAKELNQEFGLKPAIKVVGVKEENLVAAVKEACELIDLETDEFTEETVKTLKAYSLWPGQDADEQADEEPEEVAAMTDDELIDEIKAAMKMEPSDGLKVLKSFVKEFEEFKPLRKKAAGKFSTGELGNEMLVLLDEEPVEEPKDKKGKPEKSEKNKKPGVIATIAGAIESAGKAGISKEGILDILVEKFPERAKDSMQKTINVQVPNRITTERFPVVKLKNGNFVKKAK